MNNVKKVFISYSWDSQEHKEWVRLLAQQLATYGIEARSDDSHLNLGERLPNFMEKELRENDYVLSILTPNYKEKFDNRQGGVGYEGNIISGEIFSLCNDDKYIPVLREGNYVTSTPTGFVGKLGIDLTSDINGKTYKDNLESLCCRIVGIKKERPVIERVPIEKLRKHVGAKESLTSIFKPVKILRIVSEDITIPTMDGTRGSALYQIPFELNCRPSSDWGRIFIETWNRPPRWTSMHRPGIAKVIGNKIYLTKTTMEEVQKYHKETLELSVNKANEIIAEHERRNNNDVLSENKRINEHQENVTNIASAITFD